MAESWKQRIPAVATTLAGAQFVAAADADPYAAATTQNAAEWVLVAAAFAGAAADGRDLPSLLYQPAVTALAAVRSGNDITRSLAVGALQLDTIIRTEVADAGRTADQVAATTHGADGYIRLIVGRTCNRCIILAGRWYRFSTGFERHPRCDCIMVPAAEGEEPPQNARALYEAMTPEQRAAAGWSKAEQQAIDDGANIYAVTNIHRGGLYVAGGRQYTREAAGKRPRITPAQIYRDAGGDREEAIRLLQLHGYIR